MEQTYITWLPTCWGAFHYEQVGHPFVGGIEQAMLGGNRSTSVAIVGSYITGSLHWHSAFAQIMLEERLANQGASTRVSSVLYDAVIRFISEYPYIPRTYPLSFVSLGDM